MWKIRSFASRFVGPGDRKVSFLRHKEIYRPMSSYGSRPGQLSLDRPGPHRLDEFPAGYSLAGCAPAEPASASPAATEYAVKSSCRSRIFQRTANSVLTVCVSPGGKGISFSRFDHPDSIQNQGEPPTQLLTTGGWD